MQLQAGIRFVDISCHHTYDSFEIHSGEILYKYKCIYFKWQSED